MESPEWSVVFYTEKSGANPIRAFLAGLDAKTQARFIRSIEQLRASNTQAREPLAQHLEGKLQRLDTFLAYQGGEQ
jgi:hypothetical protein